MKKIAVDADGVLTQLDDWQLIYGSKYLDKQIENEEGYNLEEIYHITSEEEKTFWQKYTIEYISYPAKPFAGEVLSKLREEGNQIYIITARTAEYKDNLPYKKEMENRLITWLQQNNIPFDKIIFSPEEKLETCIENQIDIMIEDKPTNIKQISTKIPVICFDARYNKEVKGANITRAYSWYDIYHIIKKTH